MSILLARSKKGGYTVRLTVRPTVYGALLQNNYSYSAAAKKSWFKNLIGPPTNFVRREDGVKDEKWRR